jgi:hypothetical protein
MHAGKVQSVVSDIRVMIVFLLSEAIFPFARSHDECIGMSNPLENEAGHSTGTSEQEYQGAHVVDKPNFHLAVEGVGSEKASLQEENEEMQSLFTPTNPPWLRKFTLSMDLS